MQFNYLGFFGPDISRWQGNPQNNLFVDFDVMRAYRDAYGVGNSFVIIKAGQRDYADPAFAYNWRAAREVGLLRSPYWFLDAFRDGKSQAQYFWNLIKDDPGEGPLVVDFETGSGDSWLKLYDFLVELRNLSDYDAHRIWIYTGYYYWKAHGPALAWEREWFHKFGLWLAWYVDDPDVVPEEPDQFGEYPWDHVLVPHPWQDDEVRMWQKGTPVLGRAMGAHSAEIDYNWFNGGIAELTRFFNLNAGDPIVDPEPEQPPIGGNMKYQVIWNQGASVRPAPTVSNNYLSILGLGVIVDVIEADIPDLNDPGNVNKRWVKLSSGYFVASDYPNSIGVPHVRLARIDEPAPDPVMREFSFKVAGYKEVAGYLEPE